jgi:hypothetical protein
MIELVGKKDGEKFERSLYFSVAADKSGRDLCVSYDKDFAKNLLVEEAWKTPKGSSKVYSVDSKNMLAEQPK